jgi:hypothetical protein
MDDVGCIDVRSNRNNFVSSIEGTVAQRIEVDLIGAIGLDC